MKYNKVSRRHFLQGAGGSVLALPFLPSLMSKADAATLPNPKFFVAFMSPHGGINTQNMYPITSNPAIAPLLAKSSTQLYAATNHSMRSAPLSSLLTTAASNMNYLATTLDASLNSQDPNNTSLSTPPDASGYSTDPNTGADFDNNLPRVTPIFGSKVTPALLNKMNLIAGLDVMFSQQHWWGPTGNFSNVIGSSPTSGPYFGIPNVWIPTIDMVAANYPGFYGSSTPRMKSVYILNNYAENTSEYLSGSGYSVPSTSSFQPGGPGFAKNGNAYSTVGALMQALFPTTTTTSTQSTKKNFILNQVYGDYNRLVKGAYGPGRLLGQDDRNTFEQFMANIASLLNSLTTVGVCTVPGNISKTDPSYLTCTGPSDTQGPSVPLASQHLTMQLYNQMIAAAFQCGVTQSFVYNAPAEIDAFYAPSSTTPTFPGDPIINNDTHAGVFHQQNMGPRQQRMVNGQRDFFVNGFYNLMTQLEGLPAPNGNTMLDQSLLYWGQECGFNTHESFSLPVVTAGGAGGAISTGQFLDYRNLNLQAECFYNGPYWHGHVGVPYNRFLGSLLQALGVPPTAYELNPGLFTGGPGRIPVNQTRGTVPGYGHPFQHLFYSQTGQNYVYDNQLDDMSVPLPGFLKTS